MGAPRPNKAVTSHRTPRGFVLVKCLLTWLPLSLAKTARLQRLNHAQRLFRRPANVKIVNDLVTKDAFRIDHEESAQRDTISLDQNAVVTRSFLGRISGQRIFQALNSTIVARRVQPGAV